MRRFFLLLLCMAWPLSAEGQLSLDEVERLALGEPVLPSHIPSVLPSKTISLSGEWQLQGADMENSDICIKANIPCSIHKALITSGLLPDPMVGFNDTLAARRSYQGWKLTKTFTYDGCFVRPSLVFQGVANRCRVSLNGVRLGEHEGMFGGPEFDVTEVLRKGENTLEVELLPIPEDYSWQSYPTENGSWKYTVVINCVYGWHYCCIPSIGIWNDVLLKDSFREIANPFIHTLSTKGDMHISFTLTDPVSGKLVIRAGRKGRRLRRVHCERLNDVSGELTRDFHISHPALWWPNDLGKQPLYEAEIYVVSKGRKVASNRVHFGIRTLEMAPFPEGPRPDLYNWIFVVNGRPQYVKGTCWCTCDALLDFSRDRYLRFLTAAKEQHIQLLRAWGGGMPETDLFYDLCDSLGIMVFQEWPTAWGTERCQNYDALEETVVRNTLRLRNHPSLVMWCAGNETYDTDGPVIDMMGRYSISLDGTRPFHRGQPKGGSTHNHENWWGDNPIDSNLVMTSRFWGEFGFPALPVKETVVKYLDGEEYVWPSKEGSVLRHHFPIFGVANDTMRLARISDLFTDHNTLDNLIAGSQWAQVECVRHTLERARTQWPESAVGCSYKLNDNYAGMSWSSLDWYGRKKPLHYFTKSAYEPVSSVLLFDRPSLRGSNCELPWFYLDDTDRFTGKELSARVRVYNNEMAPVLDSCLLFVPGGRVERLGEIRLSEAQTDSDMLYFVCDLYHGKRRISRKWYFSNYTSRPNAIFGSTAAEIRVKRSGCTVILENESKVPAVAVNVEVPDKSDRLVLSDNFMWLDPGETVRIKMNVSENCSVSWWNKLKH